MVFSDYINIGRVYYPPFKAYDIMGRTGRGSRKCGKSWFKAGHKIRSGGWTSTSEALDTPRQSLKRLTHQEFERTFTSADDIIVPIAARVLNSRCSQIDPTNLPSSPGAALRPLVKESSEVDILLKERKEENQIGGYLDVHLPTCVNAIQECISEHQDASPLCTGRLVTAANLTTKWGFSAKAMLTCKKCHFVSKEKNLYREIYEGKPGRRPADINRAFAMGMLNVNTGPTGATRMFTSMNKSVPAPSSIVKQLRHVGEKMEEMNKADMARQRRLVKNTLEHAGYPKHTPIPVEADRQYNIALRSARRRTPFAPATQTRDVCVENITPDKKVIAFNHESKLCQLGRIARARGETLTCPGHSGCTATISVTHNSGDEKLGGKKLAHILCSGPEPIVVDKITTDADGRMAQGMSEVMMAYNGTQTETFLDTTHLNRSVAAAVSRSKIRPRLVVESSSKSITAKDREQAKNKLGDSLSRRAEREVRALWSASNHLVSLQEIQKAISKTIPAMIKCYEGKHELCIKHSFICNGTPRYEYLPQFAHGAFRFSGEDVRLLTHILNKRMGAEAVRKTRFGFTTQKAESMNHAFQTTNPKHSMHSSRNGVYRDHSAIHMVNNAVGDSILMKARVCGVPHDANSPCLRGLNQLSKRQIYWRLRARTTRYKSRRADLRRERYRNYDNTRNVGFYKSGQLEPK